MRGISIIVILGALIWFSCEKSSLPNGWYYWGEVTAYRNGDNWIMDVLSDEIFNRDYPWWMTMGIHRASPKSFSREGLGFHWFDPTRIGDTILPVDGDKYFSDTALGRTTNLESLVIDSSYVFANYSTLSDWDISGDKYEVLESADNYFLVTDWDEDEREIWGEFRLTFVFVGEEHKLDWTEDTVRFTKGKFHSKVLKERREY